MCLKNHLIFSFLKWHLNHLILFEILSFEARLFPPAFKKKVNINRGFGSKNYSKMNLKAGELFSRNNIFILLMVYFFPLFQIFQGKEIIQCYQQKLKSNRLAPFLFYYPKVHNQPQSIFIYGI